ncbi:MAG: rhodanese-like domain-containing protein [Alphaproteobacteria bacterium]|nr:rhodanese-like domain-containing protein [Alphaproteobacteria bacterium]
MPMHSVDAKTLKSWLEKDEAVLVDVREANEHAEARIPGATLAPLSQFLPEGIPLVKRKKLVIHCLAGKRGATACQKLLSAFPDIDVYNLEGGLSAWIEAGGEVRN